MDQRTDLGTTTEDGEDDWRLLWSWFLLFFFFFFSLFLLWFCCIFSNNIKLFHLFLTKRISVHVALSLCLYRQFFWKHNKYLSTMFEIQFFWHEKKKCLWLFLIYIFIGVLYFVSHFLKQLQGYFYYCFVLSF